MIALCGEHHGLGQRVDNLHLGRRLLPAGAVQPQRTLHVRRGRGDGDVVVRELLGVLVGERHLGLGLAFFVREEPEFVFALRGCGAVKVIGTLERYGGVGLLRVGAFNLHRHLEALAFVQPVGHLDAHGPGLPGGNLGFHRAHRVRLVGDTLERVKQARSVGQREEHRARVRLLFRGHGQWFVRQRVFRGGAGFDLEELRSAPLVASYGGFQVPRLGARVGDRHGSLRREPRGGLELHHALLRLLRHARAGEGQIQGFRGPGTLAADLALDLIGSNVRALCRGVEPNLQLDVLVRRDEPFGRFD